jgi:hypothetical protein
MYGYTHANNALNANDICIIYVDSVNSPTGWWWGRVVSTMMLLSEASLHKKLSNYEIRLDELRKLILKMTEKTCG